MTTVLILGAGFGGLELATRLSGSPADELRIVIVDRNDSFTFGFAKLDILFRDVPPEAVRVPYARFDHPRVEFRQEEVLEIDPRARRVRTDRSEYEPDILVVALGADYDPGATPGFAEDGYEYYSMDGARRLRDRLGDFDGGTVIVAVLSVPFKCPPAPYEGGMLLHEQLTRRGVRERTGIHFLTPMDSPIPVSADTSAAIVEALTRRGIEYSPGRVVHALDPSRHVAVTRTGELPYDLFIGIPKHRVPAVVEASGLTEGGTDGWIAVDPRTLRTPYPGVFALGDCADAPVPRAGVFAEDAARTVAAGIEAELRAAAPSQRYRGRGTCHIEFGDGLVGKVDADFLSGPAPVAPFTPPSVELAREKTAEAEARLRRWFTG
ncbi:MULTISPECIES: NAD(P)/FAD-dependent oxidoreductase [Nocardia]|uniref:NAD(P)/FAD-dependent oxidoreductase n=1 Tax=Nocardia TaxID=1817 RepID=UPI00135A8CB4|nr:MULTISPECIES: FAD-dependent oxidoreductase [Nocardia]